MSRKRPTIDDEDVQQAATAVLSELALREVEADVACLALCRAAATLIGMTTCPHCLSEALGGASSLLIATAIKISRSEQENGSLKGCGDRHPR